MDFRSCIVDELGDVVVWCEYYTHNEIMTMLQDHPEWGLSCESSENE